MFAIRKSILPAALLLALLLAGGTPAVAREGMWVYPTCPGTMSISIVNLTDYPLVKTQAPFGIWVNDTSADEEQSVPFQGNSQIAPNRTATWRSKNTCSSWHRGYFAWYGYMSWLPQGMDPKWTVTVQMHHESATGVYLGRGTWVHLAVSDTVNSEWGSPYSIYFNPPGAIFGAGWRYAVWGTPVPSLSRSVSGVYNVMTVSGTRLAASLYSTDTANLTLVIRQTNWDGSKTDDYTGWQLDFEDDDTDSMPD